MNNSTSTSKTKSNLWKNVIIVPYKMCCKIARNVFANIWWIITHIGKEHRDIKWYEKYPRNAIAILILIFALSFLLEAVFNILPIITGESSTVAVITGESAFYDMGGCLPRLGIGLACLQLAQITGEAWFITWMDDFEWVKGHGSFPFISHFVVGLMLICIAEWVSVRRVCKSCYLNRGMYNEGRDLIHEGDWLLMRESDGKLYHEQENTYRYTYRCRECGWGYTSTRTETRRKG